MSNTEKAIQLEHENTFDEIELINQASVAGHEHDEEGNSMFGFIAFLLSESVIFLSFFVGYIVYKTTTVDWL
ncbi:MAG: heme-copper oxidase subunit III, partial [Cyanobacteria bacterium J06629_18]